MDYLKLAMTYGGFTSLDRNYLTHLFNTIDEKEVMRFITPPPSVINAYFAEIYQKQSPKAATDYYFQLSLALQLFDDKPSFVENNPFVRLNLKGKAYGFAYENDQEIARVFSEKPAEITEKLLLEIAQLFPHYKVFVENNQIKMMAKEFDETDPEIISQARFLVTDIKQLKNNIIQMSSFNEDELLEAANDYLGKKYYQFKQRQVIIYIEQE
ncbi:cystathionine beta-lyase [Streptococcus sp. CSL10205-OR2]|uniref:cystathionine beta-lyase n=1 Tax=Streptococcus sp. CSL10205-OR2 TaxID=2980558 RepID=UPI0021D859F7|nr:cystathionine beta-lyase [Streptococcus sp. CSL10205-OR2]MCU9533164.1 cystathionine beta-lyase [Streptococcus sp. CSL10205-OR2]